MESLVLYYLLFALTTGLTAMYELYLPVYKQIEFKHPDSVLITNKVLTALTALFGFTALAPLTILACILPEKAERFRYAFYVGVTSED